MLWAHFDSWRHHRRCATLVDSHSSWVLICVSEIKAVGYDLYINLLVLIKTHYRILVLFSLGQHTTLVKTGCVSFRYRRYMGITMVALDDQVIQSLRSRQQLSPDVNHGILVFRMVQGSPSDLAGIRPGLFIGRFLCQVGIWKLG